MLLRSPPSMRADRASGMSVCLSLRLFVHPSSCLIFSRSVCLSVCLGVRPFVCPSVCPFLSQSLPRRVGRLVPTFQTDGSCPFNSPYIQSRVRPTDSPSSLTETQSKYCVECYDIYSMHSHQKGGAASNRATSFVISFVLAFNKVDIVAVTTILVLHVGSV